MFLDRLRRQIIAPDASPATARAETAEAPDLDLIAAVQGLHFGLCDAEADGIDFGCGRAYAFRQLKSSQGVLWPRRKLKS
jgi:hypothetical protein